MDIVSRADWGARPPRTGPVTIATPTRELWLHHTEGSERGADGMRSIQAFHQNSRGWSDVAYSFVVDPDGTVFEGRGAGIAGGHTKGHNGVSHAVCAMGNYQTTTPSETLLEAVAALTRYGHGQGWWPATLTGGHRDVGSTSCPGDRLYRVIPEINRRAAAAPPPVVKDDVMPKLIQDPDGRVYECVLGQRWHVPDRATFDALGYSWDRVEKVKATHPLMKWPLVGAGGPGDHRHDEYVKKGATVTLRGTLTG